MKKILLILFMVLTLFLGCEKEGIDGKNSLLDLIIEPAGDNCSSGGYKIISGIDLNNNSTLDENEIQNTEYVCDGDDGIDGLNSITDIVVEPSGENCPNGGYKILSGMDMNSNDTLDNNEIQNEEYICSYENEVRLYFNHALWTTISTTWELTPEFCYLKDFNINNYANIDSIVFMPTIQVQDGDIDNTCQVRLYNVTDDVAIANSEIETQSRENVWVATGNLISGLPSKTIDLGIQIKSSNGSGYVEVNTPMLILYRK